MKLLAAEVASLYVAPKLLSYLRVLEDAYYSGHERLREKLRKLEEGGVFTQLKITNFMEADYFAWYLDEWDEAVAECIMGIIRKLSDYDPSAAELEPERIRDLFKRLYQNLVPKKIRHDLGEYYTPDWLAELVLNEVGWTLETFEKVREEKNDALAPLDLRLLDPACGSGTFLVLAIGRLRQYVEEHWVDKGAALRRITKNIVGFDLNPLAVIASRTNYLIALGDMLRERGDEPIEIPVYLADSILVERKQTLTGAAYILKTAVGEFSVPVSVVEKGLLAKTLTVIEGCVKGNCSPNDFKARLLREVSLEENEISVVTELFEKLMKLEKEGKNRIWTRVLKNSFAPFFAGQFDYVVGNPPWINWENLPEDYREKTKKVWEDYHLIAKRKGKPSLGKAKRDLAMLFTYVCIDRYLKERGKFGFLITQTVFKSMAGEGFRNFWIPPEGPAFKVTKVHDLVELLPFEGAQNRTAAMFCLKGEETKYPVIYTLWKGPSVSQDLTLEEILKITSHVDLEARPLMRKTGPWSTLTKKAHEAVSKIIGNSHYRAYAGVFVGVNHVYWVKIYDKLTDETLLAENVIERAANTVKPILSSVDRRFVYPLLRGRDVKKWQALPSLHIILPIDEKGNNIPVSTSKIMYPNTYGWFANFFEALVSRRAEPYATQLKPLREKTRDIAEKMSPPFYMVFNVSNSLSPFKVVWKEQARGLIAAVIGPVEDKYVGRSTIIPDHKLMYVPCDNVDEAHFICAILNSCVARLIAKSYTVETQISTHILDYINIPKFNPSDKIHLQLAQLSKEAHKLAAESKLEELQKLEEAIDKKVAQLYRVSEDELKEIKKCLAMLEGEETGEEGEEVVDFPPTLPDISLRNNVVGEGKPFDVDVVVSNPFDKPLTNVSAKLRLFDGRLIEKSFERVEGEVSFPVSFDGLKAGEYKIEAVFSYVFENTPKRVEKNLTIYVKGGEVKHVERSFRPEELLGV